MKLTNLEAIVKEHVYKRLNEVKIIPNQRLPTGRKPDSIAAELANLSGEQLESRREFINYVREYYTDPWSFGIEKGSSYYKALEYAYDNPGDAFERYTNYWKKINLRRKK